MKTWKPDTCDCYVEEIYSGSEITGMGQVLRKCAPHAAVADAALYGVLYSNPDGENRRKNLVWKDLLGRFVGSLSETRTKADSTTYLEFKSGVDVRWAYSGVGAVRVLTVTITGVNLTVPQKNAAQSFCDTRFGAGKVVLVN